MVRPATIRSPATREQADAYRFGLRRMEAALVRGDTVLAHEQLRSQRRAAFAGVLVALLALGGVALHALIAPAPDWTGQKLVVARAAGTLYAVGHGPDRLVPVTGTAAGRLVLAALGDTAAATAVPVTVNDDDLADAPRSPVAAVPGALGVRPEGPGPTGGWAVCDRTSADGRLLGTTVVAGGAVVSDAGGAVLAESGRRTFAIIAGVRHEVDPTDVALLAGLGVAPADARPLGPALLSVLPEGVPLGTPRMPHGTAPAGIDARVGDVVATTGGTHLVVLPGGVQPLPPLVARVLAARPGRPVVTVAPAALAAVPRVRSLDLDAWPEPPADWAARADVVCWTWTPDGVRVSSGDTLPAPSGPVTVELAQADGAGPRVDAVVLSGGAGGPVRAKAGALLLVSTTGVVHPVADDATAAALGVGTAAEAPDAVLRLLPAGPALDLGAVRSVVDVPDGS